VFIIIVYYAKAAMSSAITMECYLCWKYWEPIQELLAIAIPTPKLFTNVFVERWLELLATLGIMIEWWA